MTKTASSRYTRLFGAIAMFVALTNGAHAAEPMTFVMEPFPPFVIEEKGSAEGPFPETVRAVCESMKIQCKFEIYPWRRAYLLAEQGMVDGIFVLLRTPEREKDFYFTDNVFQTSYAVFARQPDKLVYTAPKDLSGYTVAAYGPSGTSKTAEEAVKQVASIRMEIEVDNITVLRKLAAGRYGDQAVAVVNQDVGLYLLRQEKIDGLKVVGNIKKIDYTIGLPRKRLSQEQADQFNAGLRELIKKGAVKAIADRYGLKTAL
jgi:polar amino acid transport system substrate-binding protein